MKLRPFVHLKAAMSLDGCIDDAGPTRLVLSSEEDRFAIDALRARMDAILIGAETLRRDDPRLLVRDPAHLSERQRNGKPAQPTRIVWTRSGRLPASAQLFAEPFPILIARPEGSLSLSPPQAHIGTLVLPPEKPDSLSALLEALHRRGIERLLVEGGADVLRQWLASGEFDAFRLAIAPRVVGARGVRLFDGIQPLEQTLQLVRSEALGQTTVLHLEPKRGRSPLALAPAEHSP